MNSDIWRVSGAITALLFVLLAKSQCTAADVPLANRADVVRALRHAEKLVRSAEVRAECRVSRPDPSMAPLVADLCRLMKAPLEQYELSDAFIERQSYSMHWKRDGEKEWLAKKRRDGSTEETAFDGNIVRTAVRSKDKHTAAINTMESADWRNDNRLHPFSIVYLFYERPFSELVEKGKDFRMSDVRWDGLPAKKLFLVHPDVPRFSIELVITLQGRLVERRVFALFGNEIGPFPREVHRILDYQPTVDASGETIWFPRKAEYRYGMGRHPSGTMAEYKIVTYEITDITLNPPISDDQFTIRLPDDVPVWDGVTNLGWLEPGERPSHLFPEVAIRRRISAGLFVGVCAMLLTLMVQWRRRYRNSR